MMKITTITVLVISLLLLYGDGAVSRNHSNPSSVDKDDARLATDNEPPKVDSDWKEIIIKAVESNVKSNSASKKKAAGKLLKDVQNAFKSGIKYPIFRVGNRNVRGYLGDEKSKERKENECWFQRKLREWGTIFMNFFRKIFHRPVKTDSTVATESELEALKKSQNGGVVGSPNYYQRQRSFGFPQRRHMMFHYPRTTSKGIPPSVYPQIQNSQFQTVPQRTQIQNSQFQTVPQKTQIQNSQFQTDPQRTQIQNSNLNQNSNFQRFPPRTQPPHPQFVRSSTCPPQRYNQWSPPRSTTHSLTVSTFEEMEDLIEKRYPYFGRIYCQLGDEIPLDKESIVSLKLTLSPNDRKGHSEVGLLGNNGWVINRAIEAYLYVLSLRYKHFVFNVYAFWLIVAKRNPQNYAQIMARLNVIRGKTHYAIPILFDGHWFVGLIRLDLREWTVLDSSGEALPPFLLTGLSYLAQMIQQKIGQPNVKMTQISRTIQTQKDDYNCGVFVCWYVKRFILNEEMHDIAFNPDQFRIEIFNAIVEHC